MFTLRKTQWLVFSLTLCAWGIIFYLNFNTPFRAEHWALVNDLINAENVLDKFSVATRFVCFGVKRFQPLAFQINWIVFSLFGDHFWAHLTVSLGLHFGCLFAFLFLYETMLNESSLGYITRMRRFPLESALFLSLATFTDVVLWSFYQYLQLATLLATTALAYALRKQQATIAIIFAVLASLIYEIYFFILIFIILKILFERNYKYTKFAILTGVCLFTLLIARYLQQIQQNLHFSSLSLDFLLRYFLSWGYQLSTFMVLQAGQILYPGQALTGFLYELAPYAWLISLNPLLVILLFIAFCFVFVFLYRSHKNLLWVSGALVGMTGVLVWVRLDDVGYVLKQFRYYYALGPLVLSMFFYLFYQLHIPKFASLLILLTLISIQLHRAVTHGERVANDWTPLATFAQNEKLKSANLHERINTISHALLTQQISVPSSTGRLIYNGSSCIKGSFIQPGMNGTSSNHKRQKQY